MADLRIRQAIRSDVEWIAPRLRPADRFELLASTALAPERSLELAFELSTEVWTGTVDDVPACIFGVSCLDPLLGAGIPWMLTTALIEAHAPGFLRGSRAVVAAMRQDYTQLENHVDARNVKAIEWLRWLGFAIHEQAPFGPFGVPFHRFTWGGGENV